MIIPPKNLTKGFLYLDELAQSNTEKNSSRSTIDTEEDVDFSAGESGVKDHISGSSGSDDNDRGIKMMQKLLLKAKNALKIEEMVTGRESIQWREIRTKRNPGL